MKCKEVCRKSQPTQAQILWPHQIYLSIHRLKGNEINYLDFFENSKKDKV